MAAKRSAFFFTGRLDPADLANFNVQNEFLRDRRGGVLELLRNGIAVWWPSRPSTSFDDLRDSATAWFDAVAAAYFLETAVPLEPTLVGWVEALDVTAHEAMIGIADRRFYKTAGTDEGDVVNQQMRKAIALARRLRGAGELERAALELLTAANDSRSPQAALSCFRSLECVRRVYEPRYDKRRRGWSLMRADLGIKDTEPFTRLLDAAEAIRHGDVPRRRSERHPVNRARNRIDRLVPWTADVVARAIDRKLD